MCNIDRDIVENVTEKYADFNVCVINNKISFIIQLNYTLQLHKNQQISCLT